MQIIYSVPQKWQQMLLSNPSDYLLECVRDYEDLYQMVMFELEETYTPFFPEFGSAECKQHLVENYGVEFPLQSEEIMQRKIETEREKFGTDYYFQSAEFKEYRNTLEDNGKTIAQNAATKSIETLKTSLDDNGISDWDKKCEKLSITVLSKEFKDKHWKTCKVCGAGPMNPGNFARYHGENCGKEQPKRSFPNKPGKSVVTPLGEFISKSAAAKAHGFSRKKLERLLNNEWKNLRSLMGHTTEAKADHN